MHSLIWESYGVVEMAVHLMFLSVKDPKVYAFPIWARFKVFQPIKSISSWYHSISHIHVFDDFWYLFLNSDFKIFIKMEKKKFELRMITTAIIFHGQTEEGHLLLECQRQTFSKAFSEPDDQSLSEILCRWLWQDENGKRSLDELVREERCDRSGSVSSLRTSWTMETLWRRIDGHITKEDDFGGEK